MEEKDNKNLSEGRLTAFKDDFYITDEDVKSRTRKENTQLLKKRCEDILDRLKKMDATKEKKIDDNQVISTIIGFVVGDALGVPVEFSNREDLDKAPVTDMMDGGFHNVGRGTWSDDTSLTLATMDSIADLNNVDYDDIMKRFTEWLLHAKYSATNKVFDVGNTTRASILEFLDGTEAIKCGGSNEFENGNGSLMRMAPIVLTLYNKKIYRIDKIQIINNLSSLTHAHPISKLGCLIYNDYINLLLDGNSKEDAYDKLGKINYSNFYGSSEISKYDRILKGELKTLRREDIKSTGYIVDTLEASIWSILNTNSYKDAVLTSINLGEDTDTIGAITGSVAGLVYGLEQIPKEWIEKIENYNYIEEVINKFLDVVRMKEFKKENFTK